MALASFTPNFDTLAKRGVLIEDVPILLSAVVFVTIGAVAVFKDKNDAIEDRQHEKKEEATGTQPLRVALTVVVLLLAAGWRQVSSVVSHGCKGMALVSVFGLLGLFHGWLREDSQVLIETEQAKEDAEEDEKEDFWRAEEVATFWLAEDEYASKLEHDTSACKDGEASQYVSLSRSWMPTLLFASACVVPLAIVCFSVRMPQEILASMGSVSLRGIAMVAALVSFVTALVRSLEPLLKASK